jgi:CubicO group peptidase (beta-lactamase class C family)
MSAITGFITLAATALLAGEARATKPDARIAAGCAPARWGRALVADDPVAKGLHTLLTRYAQHGFSGAILLVNNGRPRLNQGYGWADAEAGIASSPNTLYDVASLAKTFTAAAILDLESRGKLKTSDKLSDFIPGIPADKAGITLHQILTHTAGFRWELSDIGVTAEDRTEDFVRKALASDLVHPPGGAYRYTNVGYGLLALVIQKVSGQTWQAYVRERLIKRANLRDTFVYGDTLPKNRIVARGYMGPTEEEVTLQPRFTSNANSPLLWGKHPVGAVGILTSAPDLQRWWCALNGSILPPAQRLKMFTIQAANQGYGWNITQENGVTTRISRGGSRQPFISQLTYYPQQSALLAFVSNKFVQGVWPQRVLSNVDRALSGAPYFIPPAIAQVAETALRQHVGTYVLEGGGKLNIRLSSGILSVGAEGASAVEPFVYSAGGAPSYLRQLEGTSELVVRALSRGDYKEAGRLGSVKPEQLARLETSWSGWMRETGGFRGVEVLGSTPGAEGNTRVFLRLQGPAGQKVFRFLIKPGTQEILAWGDDVALPFHARLLPQSQTEFATFDFDTGRTFNFRFDGAGIVEVAPPGGVPVLRAKRAEAGM